MGYYMGEEEEGKETNLSASPLISTAEREYRKRVLSDLNYLISGPQASADDALDEEVTDREWFFLISMAQSFAKGSGLPSQAWQSSIPVWITGRNNLASSSCERARQAHGYGLRTLVLLPSEIGVIELGSMALNSRSMDLVNQAMVLLNSIHSWAMARPIQPGESESSIGNSAIVRSKGPPPPPPLLDEGEEVSLELHLGFRARPVKPKNESKSSPSSEGNYPAPMFRGKTQFSGTLRLGNDNRSDSTDINAFVRILKRRRG